MMMTVMGFPSIREMLIQSPFLLQFK
jgi:hypothetical protein